MSRCERYFSHEMENLEGDWNVHKKKIKIERSKGGIRKQIPKSNELNSLSLLKIWRSPI